MSLLHALRRPHIALRCISRRYTSDDASKTSKKPTAGRVLFHRASTGTQDFSVGSIPASTCPTDTILPGINYLKGQAPVVALADEEYPEWLWTILQPKVLEDDGPGGKFERAKRREANRKAIKDRNFMLTQ
jgi:large subunit ribosomal protein L54